MESDFTGFYQGVKEILKARDGQLQGIRGAVAELVRIEKQHELAIETALGAQAQHVVVTNEQHAREAIRFLKQKRFGRATFLPMSVIKPRMMPDAQLRIIANEDEFVGLAIQLIRYDEAYQHVLSNLLGSIVVAKTLEGANKLAAMIGHRFRIVTLDGDVVNPGGSMTGGSVKQNQTSLVGRKRELDDLTHQTEKLERTVHQLEQQMQQQKQQRVQQRTEHANLQQTIQAKRLEWQEQRSRLKELELTSANMEQQYSRMDREEAAAAREEQAVIDRLNALAEALVETNKREQQWKFEIEELEAQLKEQQNSREDLQEKLVRVRIGEAESKQRVKHVSEQFDFTSQQLTDLKTELKDLREEFELLSSSMNSGSSGEEQLTEQIHSLRKEKESVQQQLKSLEEKRAKLDDHYADLEEQLKRDQSHYALVHDDYKHQDVRLNRLDVDLEHRLEKLRVEYELSFEAAVKDYPLEGSIDDAKTRLKLLKLTIEELGPVNLGSIEEFERVNERYSFYLSNNKIYSKQRKPCIRSLRRWMKK